MDIQLQKISQNEGDILERLFQLFKYDTSSLSGADIGDDGLYHGLTDIKDYSSKENYYSCLIKVDGKLAGVCVVRFEEDLYYLRHFFILRNYRRQHIGLKSAQMIFDMFSGKWRVSTMDFNQPAIAFWEKTCGEYTKGNYHKMCRKDNKASV